MLVFQCDTPEQLRTDIIQLIRQTIISEKSNLQYAVRQRDKTVSQGKINVLAGLADIIAEAKIEPAESASHVHTLDKVTPWGTRYCSTCAIEAKH
jgi:hypothetical protein